MSLSDTIVDRCYSEFREIEEILKQNGDLSLYVVMSENSRKNLILVAASFFENQLQKIVREFVSEVSNSNELILGLVHSKAIDRQYHTWFDWEKSNANKFFSLFGKNFKDFVNDRMKDGQVDDVSIKAFLEIGQIRNYLVHNNFGEFRTEKTMEEVYEQYLTALKFVEIIPNLFKIFQKEMHNNE